METAVRKRTPKAFLRIDGQFRRAYLTITDYPEWDRNKRYRENYPGREIAHHWSANRIPSGKAGNIYFTGGTIYSYGSHFPMARHVINRKGEKAIFFTTRTYSSSTARHLRYTRQAIPRDAKVFHVYDPQADTKSAHRRNIETIKAKVLSLVDRAKRARGRKAILESQALALIQLANDYAAWVGLPDRLGSPTGGDLLFWAQSVQEQAEIALRREEGRRKRLAEKRAREWEEATKKWQAFEGERTGSHPTTGHCYLRVSRGGKFIQTSLGMTVPIEQVLPVLEAIRKGEPCNPVGGFEVKADESSWSGQILWIDKLFTIGCHRVTFEEIERAASAAGL